MSELDTSLSDSEDWLEISSNQSDNDSLSSRDSDIPSMPPSRRSSMSIGSSVDGQIDAWEGFADDGPEELVPDADPVVAVFAAAEQAGPRVADEQFVTAALEQSLVGTLSASRSSSLGVSSTVHNSLRDLRLSFPDPITSSRDELNRSYEAVSSSETHCITDDDSNSPMTTAFPEDVPPLVKVSPLKDESGVILPGEPHALSGSDPEPVPVYWWDGRQIKDFDIVLYGSTSQSRDFAQWLLSIFATGGILLSYEQDNQSRPRLSYTPIGSRDPSSQTSDRPSLAIVSVPSSISRLPKHTLYLPVLFPVKETSVQDASSQAYQSWSLLDSPAVRTLRLIKDSESQIIVDSMETRKMVDPQFVYQELCPLLPAQTKRPLGMLEQLRPVHACRVTLIDHGFCRQYCLPFTFAGIPPAVAPVVPAHTTPSTFWNMFGTPPNCSVAPLPTAPPTGNMAVMPSTLKEFALAVFNPATTTPPVEVGSISVAPSPSGARGGTIGSPVGECKLMTWSEKAKSTKDVILRPSTALSKPPPPKSPPTHTPSVSGNIGKVSPLPVDKSTPVTSLSLKVVDSLSEVVDATMKALEEVVGRDLKELMTALDDLMRAIGRQTTMIVADTKSRAQILRERLNYRNERAKGKARELKQMGEQFVSFAGERLKARAEIAKTRAHSLKKSFMSTGVWRTYVQAHGEWVEKLETKRGKRRDRKRERKVGSLFAKLKERRENRKKRVST
ncbi:hypothetical protein B0H19DRAFT_1188471 [Mycena capillaripes]|nr:hypothetical protein B0H19DRAFT_1188471 [Mycena capillaripes]